MTSHLVDTESRNVAFFPVVVCPSDQAIFSAKRSEHGAASGQAVEEPQELWGESSGNLIYAGYPYDPYK